MHGDERLVKMQRILSYSPAMGYRLGPGRGCKLLNQEGIVNSEIFLRKLEYYETRRLLEVRCAVTFSKDGDNISGRETGEDAGEAMRLEGMKEYEEMKELLLGRTWKFGALFSVYLLLVVNGDAAVLQLVGSSVGYLYLRLLMKEVDEITPDTEIPMMNAEEIEVAFARNLSKLGAAYKQAARARLLLPVALAAGCSVWNAINPDAQIGIVEEGCLIGGFLGYKISLFLKIYDDLKPRLMTQEELMRASRPVLEDLEDVSLDFRKKETDE